MQVGNFQCFAGVTSATVHTVDAGTLIGTAISVVPSVEDATFYTATFENVPPGLYRINFVKGVSIVAYMTPVTFTDTEWYYGSLADSLPQAGPVVPGAGSGLISSGDVLPSDVARWVSPLNNASNVCQQTGNYPGYIVQSGLSSGLLWSFPGMTISEEATPPDPDHDLTVLPSRYVMFQDPFCGNAVHLGKIQIKDGQLALIIPNAVLNKASIYNMEVVWTQDGVTVRGSAIVSVEQSLMGRALISTSHGPLQFSRVQTRLRDTAANNDVLGGYEFSTEEFITAMLEAVEYYNEALPDTNDNFNITNFPYRMQWLDATIARLLMTSALWQQRNYVEIQGEGISSTSRSKYPALMTMSQSLWANYQRFVAATKHATNASQAFTIMR